MNPLESCGLTIEFGFCFLSNPLPLSYRSLSLKNCCIFYMSRHLASFLSKIYKLSVQKLEYSAVSRLLKNMAEDTTCNAEQFSEEPHKTQGENDGLKRCLDDDNTTEDTGKKRMKTEKVQENASIDILQSAHIELQGDVPLHSSSPPPSPHNLIPLTLTTPPWNGKIWIEPVNIFFQGDFKFFFLRCNFQRCR